ncbi:hypothetical protein ABBQ38_011082 [Trebouxia sp. C0009 RCD-2024]
MCWCGRRWAPAIRDQRVLDSTRPHHFVLSSDRPHARHTGALLPVFSIEGGTSAPPQCILVVGLLAKACYGSLSGNHQTQRSTFRKWVCCTLDAKSSTNRFVRGSCKACQSPKAGGSSSALQSSCGILVSSDTGADPSPTPPTLSAKHTDTNQAMPS